MNIFLFINIHALTMLKYFDKIKRIKKLERLNI